MTVPVVLYVPNLIGYTRIILGIAAFAFVRSPMVFIALYFTSQGLDAVDGVCARMCNQSERCSVFTKSQSEALQFGIGMLEPRFNAVSHQFRKFDCWDMQHPTSGRFSTW